jgi:hypothetical protein
MALQQQNVANVKILECLVEVTKVTGVKEEDEGPLILKMHEFVKAIQDQVTTMTELINKFQVSGK